MRFLSSLIHIWYLKTVELTRDLLVLVAYSSSSPEVWVVKKALPRIPVCQNY